MNKKLVKDNAKSFDDREGHSRDFIRCARRPKAFPRCHIHAFIPAHLRSQILFHGIHALAFTPPHSRRTYAAAFTQHLCSSIDATTVKLPRPHRTYSAALTPQHSPLSCRSIYAAALTPHFCRRIHAAACIEPHLCCRSYAPAFTPQHLCCSIHAAAFFRSSHAAALMQ